MDVKKLQKEIFQNKLNKGFNTTDVPMEFCLLYGEVSEAYDAYKKKKEDLQITSIKSEMEKDITRVCLNFKQKCLKLESMVLL